jgi:hypothetical protein
MFLAVVPVTDEYHMPISLPRADALGARYEIRESVSQAVIGRYGCQDFAYEPGIKRLFLYRSFRVSPSLPFRAIMVNITYDACELLFFLLPLIRILNFAAAGDINWYNPATNQIQVYNTGDIAWIITATALVWIMIPGVGFFYSGLLRRKNALSMLWLCMVCLAVVSFQVAIMFSLSMLYSHKNFNSGSFGGVSANN